MTKLKNPEDYEALVMAMAFIDAAINAINSHAVNSYDGYLDNLNDIRNDLNRYRLACLGGEFGFERFAVKQSIEGGK